MVDRIRRLRELAALFLRLGATAFGGPAAHIVLMRHEVVDRRGWVTDAEYAEMIALANLVPGPNSTEVAMHIGRRRAGGWGLVTAGVAFILPAFVLMTGLAWAYVEFGSRPRFQSVLTALAPVVVVLIVDAVVGLARTAVRSATEVAILVVAVVAASLGVHELAVLVAGGVATWAAHRARSGRGPSGPSGPTLVVTLAALDATGPALAVAGPVALAPLFLVFLEIGAVLYGSGYVLYAFLEQILVHQHHWITRQQLLDAVSAGQLTPGPLFTTATFLGYTIRGLGGAVLATVGIFLPAFVFVGLTDRVVRRLRDRAGFTAALRGVVAASLGLMVAVAVILAREAFTGVATVAIGVVALGVLWWRRPNPIWLIAGAAVVGIALPRLG